jgi:hypothetical protein
VTDGTALGQAPRGWVEKTPAAGRPDRQGGEFALCRATRSPLRAHGGGDIYRFRREARPGDLVLHLSDSRAFVGVSRVAADCEEFGGVPGTDWGEGPSFLSSFG